MAICRVPVTVRARRSAAITASEPVLQARPSSPVISQISRATSPASSECGSEVHARSSCSRWRRR